MDYSIVIPVFNKAGLTRNCLSTLQPTLAGAGEGEVIVVDNASTDETPEMLAEFPWIRLIRNEKNLGFAGANNQAARVARGKHLVLLNNDTQGFPGWLAAMLKVLQEPGVGIVGARLLYPDKTIQHAGVVIAGVLFGRAGLAPFHHGWQLRGDDPDVSSRREYQVVTGACIATPRDLYLELGGLDEIYWNGYEDVDYCLKVRERGLKIVYEPAATLYHFESQSGVQRFRKVFYNIRTLADRWSGKVAFDATQRNVAHGKLPVLQRDPDSPFGTVLIATPPTTAVVHGAVPDEAGRRAFETMLRNNVSPIPSVIWCDAASAVAAARDAMRVRGERYVALVASDAKLVPGWLDELIAQCAAPPNVAAATYAPELATGENVATLATDARCTLLALKQFPQHLELGDFDTLDGAVADLLLRELELARGVRGAAFALGELPAVRQDTSFERRHGRALASIFDTSSEAAEAVLRARTIPPRGLVSIVTLSWNAHGYTKKALESIRANTSEPYEVIVVDNGSGPETLEMLAAIDDPHVRIIYNPKNRGYAGGNNDGIAAARGQYVVVLNNDVIVTDGWLDGLLDPFDRTPGIGVTAPRSNKVVGHQQLPMVKYDSEEALVGFAAARREAFYQHGYFADRAIGLCLCISRTVLEQVGGFDERFELGNFEDDDFCIRVRGAGYSIFVCDDVFIHHFGSQSFAANNVDYTQTMTANWAKFSAKWGFPAEFPKNGYQPRQAFRRGFDPAAHRFAIHFHDAATAAPSEDGGLPAGTRLVFTAAVTGERDWPATAEFVKRFVRAFKKDDGVLLAIGTFGEQAAQAVASRVERVFERAGVDVESGAYVEVSDEESAQEWRARFEGLTVVASESLDDKSPSALRRLARGTAPA